MDDIRRWLRSIGLGQYADVFDEIAIDWDVLPDLDHAVLQGIGITAAGDRLRLLKAIQRLDAGPMEVDDSLAFPPAPRQRASGEAELFDQSSFRPGPTRAT